MIFKHRALYNNSLQLRNAITHSQKYKNVLKYINGIQYNFTFTSPDCTKTFCYESAYTSRVLSEIKGNTNINIEARYRCLFTVTMYI